MAQTTRKTDDGVPVGAIAAGVLAAGAAAAAGYYFYGSKKAPQHRKQAVSWAHNMKRDILKEAKRIQGLGEDVMHVAVDRIAQQYKETGVDPAALAEVVKELKANWKKVRAEASGARASAKKTVKRATKKVAKKSAKKRA